MKTPFVIWLRCVTGIVKMTLATPTLKLAFEHIDDKKSTDGLELVAPSGRSHNKGLD